MSAPATRQTRSSHGTSTTVRGPTPRAQQDLPRTTKRGPHNPTATHDAPAAAPSSDYTAFFHNPYLAVPRTFLSPLAMLQSSLIASIVEMQSALNCVDPLAMPRRHVFDLASCVLHKQVFCPGDPPFVTYSQMVCKAVMLRGCALRTLEGSVSSIRLQCHLKERLPLLYHEAVEVRFGGRFHDFVGSLPGLTHFIPRADDLAASYDLRWYLSPHELRVATKSITVTIQADQTIGRNVRCELVDMFIPRYVSHALDLVATHTRWDVYNDIRNTLWASSVEPGRHTLASVCRSPKTVFGVDVLENELLTRKTAALMEVVARYTTSPGGGEAAMMPSRRATCTRYASVHLEAMLEFDFPSVVQILSRVHLRRYLLEALAAILETHSSRSMAPAGGARKISIDSSASLHAACSDRSDEVLHGSQFSSMPTSTPFPFSTPAEDSYDAPLTSISLPPFMAPPAAAALDVAAESLGATTGSLGDSSSGPRTEPTHFSSALPNAASVEFSANILASFQQQQKQPQPIPCDVAADSFDTHDGSQHHGCFFLSKTLFSQFSLNPSSVMAPALLVCSPG